VRNQEAARYARWAAMAAGFVALIVVVFYAARAINSARRRSIPAQVSSSVQQQMQTFSYSGTEGDRTIFTIRASRATEFKAGNPALLEDVRISIYGRKGDRDDSIHTRECSYAQKTGSVRCEGQVTIDIQPAKSEHASPGQPSLHIKTSNLTFDGQTGEASTPAALEFSLPQGHGRGVGVSYSTREAIVSVENDVDFEMASTAHSGGLPLSIQAASLEVRRNDREVLLSGPVVIHQGDRHLSAGKVSISLGEKFRAREVVAEGKPLLRVARAGKLVQASATTLEAELSPDGWIQRAWALGPVTASRESPQGSSRFSSDDMELSMGTTRNILREMTARGSVVAQSEQAGVSQTLKTTALRLNFAPAKQPDRQHIQQAETLGPAAIVMKDARETTDLRGPKFTAQFGDRGHLSRLLGSHVEIRRASGKSETQVNTAPSLNASFAPDGQWRTAEESGGVEFQQGDRHASAGNAKIDRASGRIVLNGSPVISDGVSRTTAQSVTLEQKSGEFVAEGGVVSTYFRALKSGSPSVGSAHIAAARLSGSASTGDAVYTGHARLWQGQSVLEAKEIAISRDDKTLRARGDVLAVFPQTSGPGILPASESKKPGPVLWQLRAPELTYSGAEGGAHLRGGVQITSGQVSLQSRTLDVDLGGGSSSLDAAATPLARGQLSRAVADGGVVVRQGDLRATAETATYTAADGKFVLSGGQPTITDASGNSTSGRSLTFFLPNDTILIDSQEGSRTLTRHRVEK
jgi:lipopolysaccharide export system protein LptA